MRRVAGAPRCVVAYCGVITAASGKLGCSLMSIHFVRIRMNLLSFAVEDCERNDGSPNKPYFMSKDLMQILHKRNK